MIRTELSPTLKLAAVDLDGTLLGPDGQISPANRQAVLRLQASGIQVVLASGRHFISMRKYTDALPAMQWVISCQGGDVSSAQRDVVLSRTFLPAEHVRETFELGNSKGLTTLAYSVDGVYTVPGQSSGLDFYTKLAGYSPIQIEAKEFLDLPIFKIIWITETEGDLDKVLGQLNPFATRLQIVRTHKRLLEFMPVSASKGLALKTLAERLAISRSEVVTFGDGDNDVSMFEWSGLSVAMPHGWPEAIRRATHTAPPGPPETAFAHGVDMIFDTVLNRTNRRRSVELETHSRAD
jgi:Cof subfamily protein (haloacid dehalogenase superfamily)